MASSWLSRMRGRWQQRIENSVNSRQLQHDIDVYRCALLALLHQRVHPNDIEERLLKMRPAAHRELAYRYYLAEMQRILEAIYKSTNGAGVANVYPPELPSMMMPRAPPTSEAVRQHRQSGGDDSKPFSKRDAAVETRSFDHPDGFRLVTKRSSIAHDEAGYGVFVEGTARVGQLVALYPGLVVAPPEFSPAIVNHNDYLVSFYSGWIIDGREWFRRGAHFDERVESLAEGGIDVPASRVAALRYRNPIGIGSMVNHVPPMTAPNVAFCELEMSEKDLSPIAAAMLPNDACPPSNLQSRFVWHEVDGGKRRTIALVALRDVVDSELFLNYRLNPAHAYAEWYWQPDEESASRRWKRHSWLG
jgi:hypothetical protein